MKRIVLAATLTLAAAFAHAQQLPPGKWWQRPEIIRELQLTNEQQDKLDEIFRAAANGLIDAKGAVEKLQIALRGEIDRSQIRRAEVLRIAGQLNDARGKLFVNCATISPDVHVEVEKLADKAGAQSLEACMASSITQAREGKLYLMCGGNEDAFRKAEPILKELASQIRFVGKAGEAAKVKALVNMVMNINTAGLAEGLGLGSALGLDLTMLREIFSQTGANSRVLETDGEDMQNREHSCFFSAAHAAKDSGIALELARSLGLDLPLARATKEQYDRMIAEGLGELDKSGIAELTFKDRHKRSGDRV